MWHLKIPKILHLYWGGQNLAYLRYLTVKSFSILNPDWVIIVHAPKQKNIELNKTWTTAEHLFTATHDYFDELNKIINVIIQEEEFYDDWSDVHRSDFLRWKLLGTTGGFWSDFDILYIKSMNELYFNSDDTIHDVVCYSMKSGFHQHSIGFLGSIGPSGYLGNIYNSVNSNFNQKDYQSIGSSLLNIYLPEEKIITPIYNMSTDVVYPFSFRDISQVLNVSKTLPNKTIGIHWFAGDPIMSKFASEFTDYNQYNNTLTKLIRDVIEN